MDTPASRRTDRREYAVSFDPPGLAVLLSTNTEVSIAPKLRTKPPSSNSSSGPAASQNLYKAGSASTPPHAEDKVILRVLPRRLVPPSVCIVNDCEESGAWVSPGTFACLTKEHMPLPEAFEPVSLHRFVTIHRLSPPAPPKSGLGGGKPWPPDLTTPSSISQPRVIHKNASTVDSAQDVEGSSLKVQDAILLRWSKDVPDCHVILLGTNSLDDWDLAWFVTRSSRTT